MDPPRKPVAENGDALAGVEGVKQANQPILDAVHDPICSQIGMTLINKENKIGKDI